MSSSRGFSLAEILVVLAIVGAPADGLALLHHVLLGHRTPRRGSVQFLGKEMAQASRRHRVEAGI